MSQIRKEAALNPHQTQLLVSVRNCEEIAPAIAGGCDILDFKDPAHGALGQVDETTLRAVMEYCQQYSVTLPLSMALGELCEWKREQKGLKIPPEITYLKIGFSDSSGSKNWSSDWQNLIQRIEESSGHQHQWIAVAYADWKQADSLAPDEVLEAASENRCAGLLIDTFSKQNGRLLDLLPPDTLGEIIERAKSSQLKIALAGSLRIQDLEILSDLAPDIIGIRGAACLSFNRTSVIQESAISSFRKQMCFRTDSIRSGRGSC
ncbi:(5-formylfuran-3-yl)methyl phosphate synthase [Gimesia sp.]|uniref:(5-formylfuran-3-yl)methyl phosphate synthase n=1 Tax=Gimesia sp. TaxID=2024833 RepID=UPI003A92E41B